MSDFLVALPPHLAALWLLLAGIALGAVTAGVVLAAGWMRRSRGVSRRPVVYRAHAGTEAAPGLAGASVPPPAPWPLVQFTRPAAAAGLSTRGGNDGATR